MNPFGIRHFSLISTDTAKRLKKVAGGKRIATAGSRAAEKSGDALFSTGGATLTRGYCLGSFQDPFRIVAKR